MQALKKLGLPTDIPVRVLLSENFNDSLCSLSSEQKEMVSVLRDVITEYNRIPKRKTRIANSRDAVDVMYGAMKDLEHEQVWVLFLNNSMCSVGKCLLSKGGLDYTPFDVRMIISKALAYNASGMILFHNHPSGDPSPSKADISETEKLGKACKVFEICLADHIIISNGKYYSFQDEQVKEI